MNRDYTTIRSNRKTLALQVKDCEVIVRAPKRISDTKIAAFVREHQNWIEKQIEKQRADQETNAGQKLSEEELKDLGEKAAGLIPKRVRYYAAKLDVSYGRITIRSQRTRWGSCSSKGNLNFNCLLMLMPPEVLDSVVVHELCHRKEMNHSAKFYEEVRKAFPDYDRWNGWLKENGSRYLNMLP